MVVEGDCLFTVRTQQEAVPAQARSWRRTDIVQHRRVTGTIVCSGPVERQLNTATWWSSKVDSSVLQGRTFACCCPEEGVIRCDSWTGAGRWCGTGIRKCSSAPRNGGSFSGKPLGNRRYSKRELLDIRNASREVRKPRVPGSPGTLETETHTIWV